MHACFGSTQLRTSSRMMSRCDWLTQLLTFWIQHHIHTEATLYPEPILEHACSTRVGPFLPDRDLLLWKSFSYETIYFFSGGGRNSSVLQFKSKVFLDHPFLFSFSHLHISNFYQHVKALPVYCSTSFHFRISLNKSYEFLTYINVYFLDTYYSTYYKREKAKKKLVEI